MRRALLSLGHSHSHSHHEHHHDHDHDHGHGAQAAPPWRRLLVAALLEGLLVRRITGRTKPADLLELLLTPFLPLLALPVFQRASRKEVEWKGRKYAQDRRL